MDSKYEKDRLSQIEKELNNLEKKRLEKLDTEEMLKKYTKIEILNGRKKSVNNIHSFVNLDVILCSNIHFTKKRVRDIIGII